MRFNMTDMTFPGSGWMEKCRDFSEARSRWQETPRFGRGFPFKARRALDRSARLRAKNLAGASAGIRDTDIRPRSKKKDDPGSSGRVLAFRQREPFLVLCGIPTAIGALYKACRLVIAVFIEYRQILTAEYT
ncbi:hypothetical protein [Rudaea sp.]|uniref:hypothetical protein n=1 Tax=Rudaea sp. TaxID=2136325 RepID=UPI00322088DA